MFRDVIEFSRNSVVLGDITLEGFFNWISGEAKYFLFIILIVLLISAIVKRSWLGAVSVIIGMAAIGMFIVNPQAILSLSEWFSGLLNVE